ncbi:MAG: hypothetical protein HXX19_17230, partial [Rhodoferax sp.]|nr:hypothetical protein [Rhodoferax sp.]
YMSPGVSSIAKKYFDELFARHDKNYSNGRTVRNMFEKLLRTHSSRLGRSLVLASDDDLNRIDIEDALEAFCDA